MGPSLLTNKWNYTLYSLTWSMKMFFISQCPIKTCFSDKNINVEHFPHMPRLIKTPSLPHWLPCRSLPSARKLAPTPWPASGRKYSRLHLPLVCTVIESRGRVLDRVDTASWKCPLLYSNLNLASFKIRCEGWDDHKMSGMSKSTNNADVFNYCSAWPRPKPNTKVTFNNHHPPHKLFEGF